ncbi:putative NRAMP family protein [Dioscorea sansibarensis]
MQIIVASWILGLCIIGINIYYLITGFIDWLIHNSLPKVANVFIGLIVFPIMVIYILSIIYLTFRKDTVVTFIDTSEAKQSEMEKGECAIDGTKESCYVTYREDLADIPLPQ